MRAAVLCFSLLWSFALGQAPVFPEMSDACRDGVQELYEDSTVLDEYIKYSTALALQCSEINTSVDDDNVDSEIIVGGVDNPDCDEVVEDFRVVCEDAGGELCTMRWQATIKMDMLGMESTVRYDISMRWCFPEECAGDKDDMEEFMESSMEQSYGGIGAEVTDVSFSLDCPFAPCFPLDSTLSSDHGVVALSDLLAGTKVLSMNNDNVLEFSEVYGLFHKNTEEETTFLQFDFMANDGSRGSVQSTKNHFMFRSPSANGTVGESFPIKAKKVNVGDYLWRADIECVGGNDCFTPVEIIDIHPVIKKGHISPHTLNGNVVVDGILASSYGSVPGLQTHKEVHDSLIGMRFMYGAFGSVASTIAEVISGSPLAVSVVYDILAATSS